MEKAKNLYERRPTSPESAALMKRLDEHMQGLPEGRGSSSAGALTNGSPLEPARDANPRCADLGSVYDDTPRVDEVASCYPSGWMNMNEASAQYNMLLDLARQLERELAEMRYVAANPHYIGKVLQQLGPMSLWTRDGLEREIASRLAASLRELKDDLGFAEWGNQEHAEVLLRDLIKKWHPRLKAA